MVKDTQNGIPEYQGILQESRITTIEDHLAKCYSSERYEDFLDAVEKIVDKQISHDGTKKKLDTHIESKISKVLDERGWKKKNLWWPAGIGIITGVIGILGLTFSYMTVQEAQKANQLSANERFSSSASESKDSTSN